MAVQTSNLSSISAQAVFQADAATLPSIGTVGINISGNFSGTLSFFGSVDGQNQFPVFATPLASSGGPQVTSTTAAGQWAVTVYGYNQVIVRMTSFTSGQATVSMDGTSAALPFSQPVNFVLSQSNQGGPQLASGLSIASGAAGGLASAGVDPAENFQGQGNVTLGILQTNAGDNVLTFVDNPWIVGLDLNQKVILSAGINGASREEVMIAASNIPSATASVPLAVTLVSPVVFGGSNAATFDNFQINGPQNSPTGAATVFGAATEITMLVSPNPTDPKRPLSAMQSAPSNPGVLAIVEKPDSMGANDPAIVRRMLELMLRELKTTNMLLAQLKDSGGMDIPGEYPDLGVIPN